MSEKSRISLIDVVIFLTFISVIAAVALPAYNSNMKRAKAYEAEINLDIIRNILLSYFQQYGHFPIATTAVRVIDLPEIGLDEAELEGEYFAATDYYYISADGKIFLLKAVGSKPGMHSIIRQIDEKGELKDTATF